MTITKPFVMGKYLVTQEQWEAVTGNNPSDSKEPKNPVERVNWDGCQQFLTKLNEKLPGGGKFQLPTEAQWEYACRAGRTEKYCFGDDENKLRAFAVRAHVGCMKLQELGPDSGSSRKCHRLITKGLSHPFRSICAYFSVFD